MNKKTYLQPALTVVNIQLRGFITASIGSTSGAEGLGVGSVMSSGSGNSRRGRSSWANDEDYED